ncbi:hypothetical protein PTSG_01951 [Salpingoeca rosetta]|uniref:Uncharacterized protein n=1 Tax=Salpingoeca rosetta (strain ATCC 50818 / BSB-021) TaxID=946362 RepID=F2TZ82_SALR5|nr:uncharacterized protein PTSG_11796 [Salpingoeca rosetta]XP_004997935.1 uncharacterized protein PTSG_01951 [Salpingoeca rosetta]EGD78906.1 hypothetical protein PTSG_11796 [Salpingoeca rosetta]EGD78979.1 hypothetical protein PTSG_01951 [Salpingoeca rosetta]|eukprot:XP_004997862.1 hypothetical protein PTSG_11796 [Salpingoeca rosetta]
MSSTSTNGSASAAGTTTAAARRTVKQHPNSHLNNPSSLNLLQIHEASHRQFVRLLQALQNTRKEAPAALIFDDFTYELILRIVPECRPVLI